MPTKKRKFDRDSIFIALNKEVSQAHDRRAPLIRKLEKAFGGKVITLFTSFGRRNALIADEEAEMIESILSVEHTAGEKLFLVINSPGGSALAAERIVNTCRAYSNNQFEVVVPHMAKSAATMICFGSAVIHMSKTAELGPVDPQVPYWPGNLIGKDEEAIWISAEEYVRSYDNLVEKAAHGQSARIEPYLQQLNRYDSRFIEQLRSAQLLAKDISVRMLCSLMMLGKGVDEIQKKITVFLSQQSKGSHGRMINAAEAADCGLTIKTIDLQSESWQSLWELYVRSDWMVANRCGKIIETAETGVQA
jgi:hypothetical protein